VSDVFKRKSDTQPGAPAAFVPIERVTSVLGPGIQWQGSLQGSGGIRIEGSFEGDMSINGLVVIGQSGQVNTEKLNANTVIVAGLVHGNINAEKLEIRSTGRVWGDVKVISFSTEDGAFLRGHVQMEEKMDLFPQDSIPESMTVDQKSNRVDDSAEG